MANHWSRGVHVQPQCTAANADKCMLLSSVCGGASLVYWGRTHMPILYLAASPASVHCSICRQVHVSK
jgi:hypothetical protein